MATDLSDEEVICGFMEPKPEGSWMRDIQPTWWYFSTFDLPIGWHVVNLDLEQLHEVEARLKDAQWRTYIDLIVPVKGNIYEECKAFIHASAAQKIKALAAVLRNGGKY